MGYYIQGPACGKAAFICEEHGGMLVSEETASDLIDDPDFGVVVIMQNGPFDAAGFAFSRAEFAAFTDPYDRRPKQFVVMDRKEAEQLSGFSH